jgi:hypothetical protein
VGKHGNRSENINSESISHIGAYENHTCAEAPPTSSLMLLGGPRLIDPVQLVFLHGRRRDRMKHVARLEVAIFGSLNTRWRNCGQVSPMLCMLE